VSAENPLSRVAKILKGVAALAALKKLNNKTKQYPQRISKCFLF